MKGVGRIGLVLRCTISECDGMRLLIVRCQGGRSRAWGRLLMLNDLQPIGTDRQAHSFWLRGVTQVLLA